MTKKTTLVKLQVLFFFTLLIVSNKTIAQVTTLTEGFDDFSATGWITVNNSTNANTGQIWSQGNPREFNAYSGGDSSYAAADYESIGRSAEGTISNWLISPELNLTNGGAIIFYTRTSPSDYADRLQVRLSRNGASKHVGLTPGSVGDFTEVLLTINQSLDPDGYPDTNW